MTPEELDYYNSQNKQASAEIAAFCFVAVLILSLLAILCA